MTESNLPKSSSAFINISLLSLWRAVSRAGDAVERARFQFSSEFVKFEALQEIARK